MSNLIVPDKLLCKVRYGVARDLQILANIDADSFDAWTLDDFKTFKKSSENIVIIAEIGMPTAQPIGFTLISHSETRIKIIKCCVMPLLRRRSIGTQLVEKIKGFLKKERQAVSVAIRERDLTAQLFFKKNEFICTEIQQDLGEDIYLMEYFK